MRGSDARSWSLFSYVDLERRVPAKHPLRVIKSIVDDVLVALDGDFERLYEGTGRQSIAPERLLRASLLQAFYSIRSERQLMQRGTYLIVVARFIPGGRTATTFSAGYIQSFPYRRFIAADVLAGFIWGTYASCLGYFGGKTFEEQPWKGLILAFVVAVGLASGVELVRHRRERRRVVDGS